MRIASSRGAPFIQPTASGSGCDGGLRKALFEDNGCQRTFEWLSSPCGIAAEVPRASIWEVWLGDLHRPGIDQGVLMLSEGNDPGYPARDAVKLDPLRGTAPLMALRSLELLARSC
jgi:hypothetical protein